MNPDIVDYLGNSVDHCLHDLSQIAQEIARQRAQISGNTDPGAKKSAGKEKPIGRHIERGENSNKTSRRHCLTKNQDP